MDKTDIAKIAYAALNAYTTALDEYAATYRWVDTTKENRDSFIAGVEWVMNNPATTAEHQHNAWVKHKKDTGWLYGKEKNDQLRTHPLMVPWSEISLEHRTKDALFIAVVSSLLPMQRFLGS